MAATAHTEQNARAEALAVPVDEAPNSDLASEVEIVQLQERINATNAAALRIEQELKTMLMETGGQAANTSEFANAQQQVRDMHAVAESARSAVANAPTDQRTGRKIISSKKVQNLSSGVFSFIVGAEAESAKIESAKAEAHAHDIAVHTQAAPKQSKTMQVARKCAGAVAACVGLGPRKPARSAHRDWIHERAEDLEEFGSTISSGWNRFSNSVTSGVSSGIGYVQEKANDAYDYVSEVAGDAVEALRDIPRAAAAKARQVVDGVSSTVSSGVSTLREKAGQARDTVVGAVTTVTTAVGDRLHQAKEAAASALDHINPWSTARVAAPAHKPAPHRPAAPAHKPAPAHQPSFYENAKAAVSSVGNTLSHLSLPSLPSLWPSSTPARQGVTGKVTGAH